MKKKWAAQDPGTADEEKPPTLEEIGPKTGPRKKKMDPRPPLIKNENFPSKNRPQKARKSAQDENEPKNRSKNEFFLKTAPKNPEKSPSGPFRGPGGKMRPQMTQKKIFQKNFTSVKVGLPPKGKIEAHGLMEGSGNVQKDKTSSTEHLAETSQLCPGGLSKRKKREDDYEEEEDERRKKRKGEERIEDVERWEGAISEEERRFEGNRPKMRVFGLDLKNKIIENELGPLPLRLRMPSTAKKLN